LLADNIGRIAEPKMYLWVREPFCFEKAWDNYTKPTVIIEREPRPKVFFDADEHRDPNMGKSRHARALPKLCNRLVLLVASAERILLNDDPATRAERAGFSSIHAFRAHWNRMHGGTNLITNSPEGVLYDANPAVIAIRFSAFLCNINQVKL
ncbi:MAG: hypothetical protein ACPGWS_04995, partial [Solirubrobacterales bacterium]